MTEELEDARKLAHGVYEDVIVVEHRKPTGALAKPISADPLQGRHVILEMPEGSRVVDKAQHYEIDGVLGAAVPVVGASYRLIIGPPTAQAGTNDAASGGSLRYETMNR